MRSGIDKIIGSPGFSDFEDTVNFRNIINQESSNIEIKGSKENEVIIDSDCQGVNLAINFIGSSSGNKVIIGSGSQLKGQININGSFNTLLFMGNSAGVSYVRAEVNNNNNAIYIGKRFSSNGAHLSVAGNCKILIGEDAMFANGIYLRTSDMHALIDLNTSKTLNHNSKAGGRIVVGPHVWLGQDALLLKDVEIGYGSVIGARSVVSKSVSPKSLAVGVPAKVIRKNISWTRQLFPNSQHVSNVKELLSNYGNNS
ncbi:hypothetical protein GTH32_10960 [Alteromonas sp. 345S023]|uniref:Acyltransferase n=1 Tax=Alteromonas profundi TaxID=2696062 RepID=A0A7X5LLR6_9ALTE|nr:acyltransferase [Alteromonas profundi]NDV91703.1 hypothetical protein [Alteromonas profundi]